MSAAATVGVLNPPGDLNVNAIRNKINTRELFAAARIFERHASNQPGDELQWYFEVKAGATASFSIVYNDLSGDHTIVSLTSSRGSSGTHCSTTPGVWKVTCQLTNATATNTASSKLESETKGEANEKDANLDSDSDTEGDVAQLAAVNSSDVLWHVDWFTNVAVGTASEREYQRLAQLSVDRYQVWLQLEEQKKKAEAAAAAAAKPSS